MWVVIAPTVAEKATDGSSIEPRIRYWATLLMVGSSFLERSCQRHWYVPRLYSSTSKPVYPGGQSSLVERTHHLAIRGARGRVPSLFMTAPKTCRICHAACRGCCRYSTVKGKKLLQSVQALACTAFRRKDCPVLRPFGGNGGFGVPEAVQRGRPLFFWWSMHRLVVNASIGGQCIEGR